MDTARLAAHRLILALRYHLMGRGIFAARYPRRMTQKRLHSPGLVFECHSLTEANRVIFFDEEETFLRRLMGELKAEDVFYDVGACIGLFAIHAATRCRQVVAFEPEPELRSHLEANIALNGLRNVRVMSQAVGETQGTLTLFSDGVDGKSPSLRDAGYRSTVQVEVSSIDQLVLEHGCPPPTVLKVDVEGAEVLVLRGLRRILSMYPPRRIYLEVHPALLEGFGSGETEVVDGLEKAGYELIWRHDRAQQYHCVFGR